MSVITVNTPQEFDNFLINGLNNKKYLFVDFYATWCGPCKAIAPKIERLSSIHDNILFVKIDVDQAAGEIAERYKVTALPTFHVFEIGKTMPLCPPVVGANPSLIEVLIKRLPELSLKPIAPKIKVKEDF
jgi:thioredoxin 1